MTQMWLCKMRVHLGLGAEKIGTIFVRVEVTDSYARIRECD